MGQKLCWLVCSKQGLLSRRETTIWAYALRFKLHPIVNDQGELLSFQLTAANIDDHKPAPDLTYSIFGKLFGDKGLARM